MDLLRIGSARQYAKSMARQTQWDLKKRSGDFTGHKKSLQDYVNITKASSVLPQTDEVDHKLSAIMTKAQVGKKLSPDEWEYLRTKNPTMYEKLREAEQEQENYEKALKRCKTRDEAQRLHVSKLAEVMSAAKNGDEGALYRLNRLTRTMTEFTKSEEYHKMPTEAEEAIERESERQAREDALREEAELREAENEEKTASEAEQDEPEAESVSGTDADENTEPEADADAQSSFKTDAKTEAQSGFKTDAETKTESGFKSHVEAKTRSDSKTDAKAETQSGFGTERHADRKPVATDRSASRTDSAAASRASVRTERPAPPAMSFGQRAYLNQRDKNSRRRVLDAKA